MRKNEIIRHGRFQIICGTNGFYTAVTFSKSRDFKSLANAKKWLNAIG